VIYYGSKLEDNQGRLNTLVGNIENQFAWGIVRNSYGGGSPYFANSVNVACDSWCTNSWSNCYPCNPTQWSESGILSTLFARGTVPKNSNALYIIVYGIDNTYTFSQSASQMCATHDIAQTDVGGAYLYRYISLPLIKSETSKCNFLKGIGYPNGNFRSDSGAAILFHEMVESVIPGFNDDWSYGVADKCANQVMGYGTTKSNVNVGGVNYLLPSIWDKNSQVCSLGLSGSAASQYCGTCANSRSLFSAPGAGQVSQLISNGYSRMDAANHYIQMQSDQNLVVYRKTGGASWASNTWSGSPNTPIRITMQTDGNLVIYNNANQAMWASNTWGKGDRLCATIQDDGNFVIYTPSCQAVWAIW